MLHINFDYTKFSYTLRSKNGRIGKGMV